MVLDELRNTWRSGRERQAPKTQEDPRPEKAAFTERDPSFAGFLRFFWANTWRKLGEKRWEFDGL